MQVAWRPQPHGVELDSRGTAMRLMIVVVESGKARLSDTACGRGASTSCYNLVGDDTRETGDEAHLGGARLNRPEKADSFYPLPVEAIFFS